MSDVSPWISYSLELFPSKFNSFFTHPRFVIFNSCNSRISMLSLATLGLERNSNLITTQPRYEQVLGWKPTDVMHIGSAMGGGFDTFPGIWLLWFLIALVTHSLGLFYVCFHLHLGDKYGKGSLALAFSGVSWGKLKTLSLYFLVVFQVSSAL